jgi:hypothetical protein
MQRFLIIAGIVLLAEKSPFARARIDRKRKTGGIGFRFGAGPATQGNPVSPVASDFDPVNFRKSYCR